MSLIFVKNSLKQKPFLSRTGRTNRIVYRRKDVTKDYLAETAMVEKQANAVNDVSRFELVLDVWL